MSSPLPRRILRIRELPVGVAEDEDFVSLTSSVGVKVGEELNSLGGYVVIRVRDMPHHEVDAVSLNAHAIRFVLKYFRRKCTRRSYLPLSFFFSKPTLKYRQWTILYSCFFPIGVGPRTSHPRSMTYCPRVLAAECRDGFIRFVWLGGTVADTQLPLRRGKCRSK